VSRQKKKKGKQQKKVRFGPGSGRGKKKDAFKERRTFWEEKRKEGEAWSMKEKLLRRRENWEGSEMTEGGGLNTLPKKGGEKRRLNNKSFPVEKKGARRKKTHASPNQKKPDNLKMKKPI